MVYDTGTVGTELLNQFLKIQKNARYIIFKVSSAHCSEHMERRTDTHSPATLSRNVVVQQSCL